MGRRLEMGYERGVEDILDSVGAATHDTGPGTGTGGCSPHTRLGALELRLRDMSA